MQAIKDAGIVLVVILLLVSVRFSPLDETGQTGIVSLTPQVEAAAVAVPFNAVRIDPSAPTVREVDIDGAEHCEQRVLHIHRATQKPQDDVFVIEAQEVIKVLPCSA